METIIFNCIPTGIYIYMYTRIKKTYTSPLYPICTCLSQSQSLFCLDISPLIYLFVSSSSISPKFPLFNHKYIYFVNRYDIICILIAGSYKKKFCSLFFPFFNRYDIIPNYGFIFKLLNPIDLSIKYLK
jgi:hypothetical protein